MYRMDIKSPLPRTSNAFQLWCTPELTPGYFFPDCHPCSHGLVSLMIQTKSSPMHGDIANTTEAAATTTTTTTTTTTRTTTTATRRRRWSKGKASDDVPKAKEAAKAEKASVASSPIMEIKDDDEYVLWYTTDHWPVTKGQPPSLDQCHSWSFRATDLPLMIRFESTNVDHYDNAALFPWTKAHQRSAYYLLINEGYKDSSMMGNNYPDAHGHHRSLIWRMQSVTSIESIATNQYRGIMISRRPCLYYVADGSFLNQHGGPQLTAHLLAKHKYSRFQCQSSIVITHTDDNKSLSSSSSSLSSGDITNNHTSPMLIMKTNDDHPILHVWYGRGYESNISATIPEYGCTILADMEGNGSSRQILSLCATPSTVSMYWMIHLTTTITQQWPIHDPHIIALTPLLPYIPVSILLRLILDYLMDPLTPVGSNDEIGLSQLHLGKH
jgi:hypothetical protein